MVTAMPLATASARRRFLPSSIGLTVLLDPAVTSLKATVTWGDYVAEPDPAAQKALFDTLADSPRENFIELRRSAEGVDRLVAAQIQAGEGHAPLVDDELERHVRFPRRDAAEGQHAEIGLRAVGGRDDDGRGAHGRAQVADGGGRGAQHLLDLVEPQVRVPVIGLAPQQRVRRRAQRADVGRGGVGRHLRPGFGRCGRPRLCVRLRPLMISNRLYSATIATGQGFGANVPLCRTENRP